MLSGKSVCCALAVAVALQALSGVAQPMPENVTRWGAVGDGVTDDGAALQRAIDAQPPGATLDFGAAPRVYLTFRQLILRPGVRYVGSATIRMMRDAPRGTQLAVLRYGQSSGVTIEGLTLDANHVGGGLAINVMGHGTQPATNVTVRGVTFLHTIAEPRGAYDAAIYTPAGLSSSQITHNVFVDCGSGISIANADRLAITDNRFEAIHRGDAIFITFSPGSNWAGHNLDISRNTGRDLGRMAIEVWARQPTSASGIVVRDNSFEDWAPDARGNGFGISMMTGSHAVVSGNTMLGRAPGLTFGLEMGSAGAIVERNHIEGFRVGIALHRGEGSQVRDNRLVRQDEAGIQITNAPGVKTDLVIENNTISDAHSFGIWANSEGWGGSRILANTISRAAGAFSNDGNASFIGIAISPPAQPVLIANNTILQSSDGPAPGFHFAGFKVNGRSGANNGSTYRDNTVRSASRTPFGVGILLNASGSADGLTLAGNHFEGLGSAMAGAPSRGVLLRGNLALRCASSGLLRQRSEIPPR